MATLPEKVKIGPVVYTVVERERLSVEGLYGQIVYSESVIEINPATKEQYRTITLWHEILHGLLLQGGIREHDERILDVMAHGIVGLLADNPGLVGSAG